MGMTSFYNQKVLNTFAAEATHVSLHTGPPGDDGDNEVSGDGYQRRAVTFTEASDFGIENVFAIEFQDMPAMFIDGRQSNPTHLGYWDAAVDGQLLWSGVIPVITGAHDDLPRLVERGDLIRFPAGRLEVTTD